MSENIDEKERPRRRGRPRKPRMAQGADRYALYQEAVQDVEADIDFIDATFRSLRGRRARTLREDFCGTAATACEWVRRRRTNHAWGVDIDPEPLAWGLLNNVGGLAAAGARRISLLQGDVRTVCVPLVDIVLAMNFSYWLFQQRDAMQRYFRRVHRGLEEGGVFFLDAYGGYDSPRVIIEKRKLEGYTYEWEQARFNPISGEMGCYIHFSFPDRSRLDRAFSYTWRLWTLPEILELLKGAGFSRTTVYWQGWDRETGEPDGVFRPTDVGEPDAGWICYLTAEK